MKLLVAVVVWLLMAGCAENPVAEVAAPVVDAPDLTPAEYRARLEQALQGAVRVNEVTGQKEFTGPSEYVILSDFQFSPSAVRFKSGTVVRVRLSNTALVTHYFGGQEFFRLGAEPVNLLGSYVPAGQHHIPVAPYTDRDIYLFIKDPGTYLLDCFVPNHRAAGMVGQLIVEP